MSETYETQFHYSHDGREYVITAEYLYFTKHGRLTVSLRGDWSKKQVAPTLEIDWYDWSDDFLADDAFRSRVIAELDGNWPLEVIGRRRQDGDIDILDNETGERVTRIDRVGVYPVGSELSTKYEHAAGIVLTPEDTADLGIPVE